MKILSHQSQNCGMWVSSKSEKEENYLLDEEESDRESDSEINLPLSTPSTPSNAVTTRDITPYATPSQVPLTPSTPSNPATAQNKFRGEKLANQMREAIAKGSREDEERIIRQVAESSPQLRGFFERSLGEKKDDTQPVVKHPRIFEVGDRVVVKDVGGRYHGARGIITEIRSYPTRTGLLVRFDKEVSFVQQDEFIAGDLMYLPEKQ